MGTQWWHDRLWKVWSLYLRHMKQNQRWKVLKVAHLGNASFVHVLCADSDLETKKRGILGAQCPFL